MILKGKRALVTGGALRIGKAIVQALQAEGVEVVVQYRDSECAARELSDFIIQADFQCLDELDGFFERTGPIDVLVNNAAVFTKDSLLQATPKRVAQEFGVNLFAPMELMRQFALQERSEGAIVNLLDQRVRSNDVSCVPYLLAKKALENLTQLAALEYAPHIRVNAVAPGAILPPVVGNKVVAREPAGKIPLEKVPTLGNVAEAVLYLIRAEAVTGQTLFVDGGQNLLGRMNG